MNTTAKPLRRRNLLVALAVVFGFGGWLAMREPDNPMALAAPFVKPKEKWTADHLFYFLSALPPAVMLDLKKTLELLELDAQIKQLKGNELDARDVQKEALKVSQNFFSYISQDETKLNYHGLVAWACHKAGIPQPMIEGSTTFILEREIQKLLFIELWNQLDGPQREALLSQVDPSSNIKDKAAIAAMSGAAALAILNAGVAFTGFAFYSGMSVAIASLAGVAGLTVPFATYTGASWFVGILSGPIGWAVMTISGLGGVALFSRANVKKTIRLVSAIHALKVQALLASGISEAEILNL